ncbi:MAG: mannitol dehydrogenase family protein [Burkholderiaceae bacterium]
MSLPRLDAAQLAHLPAEVQRPRFERGHLAAGIVHLGLGAFARAHLLAYNDDALDAGGALEWGVTGVSLRQPDTRDALQPQQGLYTLAVRDGDSNRNVAPPGAVRQRLRVIGSLRRLLVAPEDPAAVLQCIAAAATRIISLTVTEKGYCHAPVTGELQLGHPDIVHDLQAPARPRSAIGFIAHGMAQRRAAGLGGLALMSLDNLPANGRVLRAAVLAFARAMGDAGLAGWIEARCSFPCSMVDRIVPRTVLADRAQVSTDLGADDAWPVVAEPFIDWVIEDAFAAGRPEWPGVRWAADAAAVAAAERLKLRMVNGAHSAIAYLGVVAGWPTVDAALAEPALRGFIDALLRDEVEPTLAPGSLPAGYRKRLLARFANPALAHRCSQIAMDGSQKLPQRLLGTVRDRLAAGQPVDHLALAVAAWLHFLRGHDEAARAYPIDDPMAESLQRVHRQAQALPDALARAACLMQGIAAFGDLADDARWLPALAEALQRLRERGVQHTLEAMGHSASRSQSPESPNA